MSEEQKEERNLNLRIIGWTLLSVVAVVAVVGAIAYATVGARDDYLARQQTVYDQAVADGEQRERAKHPTIAERVLRVETGATVMTKVWFSKDMKNPIIIQMLVTSGVCNTSKTANEQAMAQIKKPASAIHITCKKITELNQ